AHVIGRGSFTGDGDQLLHVTGGLELGGSQLAKSTNGALTIEADHIDLTAKIAQTISNDSGRLLIGAPLVKGNFGADADGDGNPDPISDPEDPNNPVVGQRGLSLFGVSEDSSQPAVVVSCPDQICPVTGAIAVANGDLLISASTRAGG